MTCGNWFKWIANTGRISSQSNKHFYRHQAHQGADWKQTRHISISGRSIRSNVLSCRGLAWPRLIHYVVPLLPLAPGDSWENLKHFSWSPSPHWFSRLGVCVCLSVCPVIVFVLISCQYSILINNNIIVSTFIFIRFPSNQCSRRIPRVAGSMSWWFSSLARRDHYGGKV